MALSKAGRKAIAAAQKKRWSRKDKLAPAKRAYKRRLHVDLATADDPTANDIYTTASPLDMPKQVEEPRTTLIGKAQLAAVEIGAALNTAEKIYNKIAGEYGSNDQASEKAVTLDNYMQHNNGALAELNQLLVKILNCF